MEQWARTKGLILESWLILAGLGVLAIRDYTWLATWWVLLPTAAGIGAALLVGWAMKNSRKA